MVRKPISYRQMRAIECWFRNGRKSKALALREAGYGESIVHQPHKVFNSPAVQRELELRGHGIYGITNNQKPREVEEEKPVPATPVYDFSNVSREWLQDLKERLAEVPDTPIH